MLNSLSGCPMTVLFSLRQRYSRQLSIRLLQRYHSTNARTPLERELSRDGLAGGAITRDPMTGEFVALRDIEPGRLELTKNNTPKTPPPSSSLVFGRVFTDHMLTIPWTAMDGWGVPHIRPYGSLDLEPSAVVFHYAQCLFEGLKAYRDEDGKVTIFRPDLNMQRMNKSAGRISLPTFNADSLRELIGELVKIDKHWIPKEPGHSLYIRPTLIGTQRAIGITPSNEALLFVILSPVGPYYPRGFKPVSLYGTTEYVRASPGGTGAYKLGANYAPGIVPQKAAMALGYEQNLWLSGPEHHLTEVGTMNIFVVLDHGNNTLELVTPPLDDMILPGITRQCALEVAREHVDGKRLCGLDKDLIVSERPITMKEVKAAVESGTLVEIFGTGTAAVVTTVERIGYLNEDLRVPVGPDGMGPVSRIVWREITGRQTGKIPSNWNMVISD